jgi:RNA polymerase sigma factor (sigma-70 family)
VGRLVERDVELTPTAVVVMADVSAVDEPVEATASFGELYRNEWAPMVRLARSLVDDTYRAEEVVQDACERTLLRWDRLEDPRAYLRTCVVNGCRSELRRRSVRRRIDPVVLGRRTSADDGATAGVDAAADRELLAALERLRPNQRIALTLRFWLDLSEADIAAAMGVRPGTVKSLVSRGLAELREVVVR